MAKPLQPGAVQAMATIPASSNTRPPAIKGRRQRKADAVTVMFAAIGAAVAVDAAITDWMAAGVTAAMAA